MSQIMGLNIQVIPGHRRVPAGQQLVSTFSELRFTSPEGTRFVAGGNWGAINDELYVITPGDGSATNEIALTVREANDDWVPIGPWERIVYRTTSPELISRGVINDRSR